MKILNLKLEEVNEQNYAWCLNILTEIKAEAELREHIREQLEKERK